MMMLMFDHVRRGEVAERRGVLMEIRGKHNCVLASVSTTIPPLEDRSGSVSYAGSDGKVGVQIVQGVAKGDELATRLRDVSTGLEFQGYVVEGRQKDMQVSCLKAVF